MVIYKNCRDHLLPLCVPFPQSATKHDRISFQKNYFSFLRDSQKKTRNNTWTKEMPFPHTMLTDKLNINRKSLLTWWRTILPLGIVKSHIFQYTFVKKKKKSIILRCSLKSGAPVTTFSVWHSKHYLVSKNNNWITLFLSWTPVVRNDIRKKL